MNDILGGNVLTDSSFAFFAYVLNVAAGVLTLPKEWQALFRWVFLIPLICLALLLLLLIVLTAEFVHFVLRRL